MVSWLYFIFFEKSPKKATLRKRCKYCQSHFHAFSMICDSYFLFSQIILNYVKYQRSKVRNFKQLKLRNVIYSNKNLFFELIKIIRYEYKLETGVEVYVLPIMPLPFVLFVLKKNRTEFI